MDVRSNPGRAARILAAASVGLLFAPWVHGSLVINELDYDQVGSDGGEFVELFNPSVHSIGLSGYRLSLINGATASAYRDVELGTGALAAGSFFVLCGDDSAVPNCDLDVSPDSNLIQNGAPEAVALYLDGVLLDSVSYEGVVGGFTEGAALEVADDNVSAYLSLSRRVDGIDSNDNRADFVLGCATPGYGNIAFGGDCAAPSSTLAVVPEPAVVWLMGAGLAGLLGRQRSGRRRDTAR